MIEIKQVNTQKELAAAIAIQLRIFTEEQGIPEAQILDGNEGATHMLAIDQGQPIATARLILKKNGESEMGRVGVLESHRKAGIGVALVKALEDIAVRKGVRKIVLYPHLSLESFYSHLGYTRASNSVIVVGGHDVITMQKSIDA